MLRSIVTQIDSAVIATKDAQPQSASTVAEGHQEQPEDREMSALRLRPPLSESPVPAESSNEDRPSAQPTAVSDIPEDEFGLLEEDPSETSNSTEASERSRQAAVKALGERAPRNALFPPSPPRGSPNSHARLPRV